MTRIASLRPMVVLLAITVAISLVRATSHLDSHPSIYKRNRLSPLHHRRPSYANNASINVKRASDSSTKSSKSSKSSSTIKSSSSAAAAATTKASGDLVGDSSDKNFTLNDLPKTWQKGQNGTNQCTSWGKSSQTSMCQNAFFNALDDFCLWAPPTPGTIGETERIEVAWCMKSGYGTRLIPSGAIKAAHFLQTKDYIQITGTGDLTLINLIAGDEGGELDPHGADGNGNPIGGLVFSNAFDDKYRQIHEWMMFVSDTEFCFRACKGRGVKFQNLCQHIYDTMGCEWVMPGNYLTGFDSCEGEVALPPGIVGNSTFTQGDKVTPKASPAPSSSNCKSAKTLSAAITVTATAFPTSSSAASGNKAVVAASTTASTAAVYSGASDVRPLLLLIVSTSVIIISCLVLVL
ncbi:hypothetical protein CBS101457_005629 [Exobasidium rhododendri]|nr:hypothetical protein CBS101457_005629 [Exobasidium rhododendri]